MPLAELLLREDTPVDDLPKGCKGYTEDSPLSRDAAGRRTGSRVREFRKPSRAGRWAWADSAPDLM